MVKRKLLIAASVFAAIICTTALQCYGATSDFDDEAAFSDSMQELATVPDDIAWNEKTISRTDESGHKVKYVLKDRQARVYIGKELIWESDDSVFVQDMIVADINEDDIHKDEITEKRRSKDEMVLLVWKKGRYGINKPFWIKEDEMNFSQHIFVYNISEDKIIQRWGSSYMGFETDKMEFSDGILFLNEKSGEIIPWQWNTFGFYRVENTKFVIAGDNLSHIQIYKDAIKNHDGKFEYIYKSIKQYVDAADFAMINLETPLVNDPARYSGYPCFGSPVQIAKALKNTGFDGVTLATNHRFDKGASGVTETIDALDANELIHVGSMDEKPYVLVTRNRITFALLNYTYGTNGIRPPKGCENGVNYLDDEEKIRADIREAKANSDFVIVFPHWGTEYRKEPDSMQKKWRDVFYEEGVDVVVGTHPHVIEPYEMYSPGTKNQAGEITDDVKSDEVNADIVKSGNEKERGMLIYYSLGNYISSNHFPGHNSGGLAIFEVNRTPEGVKVCGYDFVELDTVF